MVNLRLADEVECCFSQMTSYNAELGFYAFSIHSEDGSAEFRGVDMGFVVIRSIPDPGGAEAEF